jgi:rhamnulose-1-phosphate aldolase/alcohol dehydrogenase
MSAEPAPEVTELLRRSKRLGADPRNTNYAGGNTSAAGEVTDPVTGQPVEVLWVKGSGGDLGTLTEDGLAVLRLDRLRALAGVYPGVEREDEMVAAFDYCRHGTGGAAPSIDTAMHGLVGAKHVDHLHPDSGIAFATAADGEALTWACFGDEVAWVPWRRPGFQLGLDIAAVAAARPEAIGVILGGHGITAWGATSDECEANSLRIIAAAQRYLDEHGAPEPFGPVLPGYEPRPEAGRRARAAALAPVIRGLASTDRAQVGHFTDAPAVLDFLARQRHPALAALGTSCPDHFLRTKIRPLVLPYDPATRNLDAVIASLDNELSGYRDGYRAYYERCKHADSPAMRDPNAVIYLVPGVGMLSFAKDKSTARIASEFYLNAINVMRGATGVGRYVGLDEQEAFNIEYWLLEEAKLQRMPKPKSLAGRIALVTGGAGGIGKAIAARLMGEGACVVLADIDAPSLDAAVAEFGKRYGKDAVAGIHVDVTSEASVEAAFHEALLAFGGMDIIVANAGIASAAPFEDTSLDLWNRNMSILATGYFLAARGGYRIMKEQGLGGAIVFIASKNALAASAGASAYCAAKAAEVHLARSIALEGAPFGIRANTVNPDAVLRGSKIWQGEWRAQRAASNKVSADELEEVYRQRSLLKRSVYPEDIAEAVYYFASDLSSKSTGNILNVDAGNAVSFTR